jgi:hypothetical protein
LCVPRQVELRSRHIEAGSTGLPIRNGRDTGAAFLWLLSLAAQGK